LNEFIFAANHPARRTSEIMKYKHDCGTPFDGAQDERCVLFAQVWSVRGEPVEPPLGL